MAILRASIQLAGLAEGQRRFPQIRDLQIALCLPDQIAVSKIMVRVLRPFEAKDAKTKDEEIARGRDTKRYPFQPTVAYREYVQFGDPTQPPRTNLLRVACTQPNGKVIDWLSQTLVAINYLGKRGGFLQAMDQPVDAPDLDTSFFAITQNTASFFIDGVWQQLDDCGSSMRFEHADSYHPLPIRLGTERILRQVVLPYRQLRSSQDYSVYQRIANSE